MAFCRDPHCKHCAEAEAMAKAKAAYQAEIDRGFAVKCPAHKPDIHELPPEKATSETFERLKVLPSLLTSGDVRAIGDRLEAAFPAPQREKRKALLDDMLKAIAICMGGQTPDTFAVAIQDLRNFCEQLSLLGLAEALGERNERRADAGKLKS